MTSLICSICGKPVSEETATIFDEQVLCPHCLDEETIVCSHCGDRIWNRNNAGTYSRPLCEHCYEEYYTTCAQCGRIILSGDAYYLNDEPYCESCYDLKCENFIHEYGFKPDPIFYGIGPRFFGVELEIDGGGEDGCNAENILNVGNRSSEHIYCKHDGSLESGFEIVSHPMSLDYHVSKMPWHDIIDEAISLGYSSHDTSTCGLHVHVSRNALGDTEAAQDSAISHILYFIEKHWDSLLKFSRRTQSQIDRWAARYGYKDHPLEILKHAKEGNLGRYACVNLTNADTIEFRIFRGTLKYNTFIATLQMVNHICDAAISLSDDEIKALSWQGFISQITEPELKQYLKERRLSLKEAV